MRAGAPLCGVDLAQYKRNQMERRVRTWTERRGTPDLAEYGRRLRRDPEELDAFLDRVTINVSHLWRHEDQFETLRTKLLPELRRAPAAEDLERRQLLRRRGLHDRRDLPRGDPDLAGRDRRHRPRQAHGRPRPRGRFTAEDARTSPKPLLQRHFVPQPDGGWVAKPELKRMLRFENGDLLRMPVPTAATTSCSAATP